MSHADLAKFFSLQGFPLSALSLFNESFLESILYGNLSRRLNLTRSNLHHPATGFEEFDDECWMDLLDLSYMYVVPTIIAVGLVGNLLACVVFLNTHLKMRSSSYYLAALAVADLGYLLTCLLVWLGNHADVHVFNADGWCQAIVYVSSVCSFLSVWLIVAFTIERFIAVQYPLHRPLMCTVHRARTIIACLSVLSLLLHGYSFFTAGLVLVDDEVTCSLVEHFHELMRIINILDSLLTLIIPLFLILVMNAMITRKLIKFGRKFNMHDCLENATTDRSKSEVDIQNQSSSSAGRRTPSNHSAKSATCRHVRYNNNCTNIEMGVLTAGRINVRSSNNSLVSTRTQHSITKMLLLISTMFVVLNLPSYVIRLYTFIGYSLWQKTPPAYMWCVQQFAMLLYYMNFSINFLLYSMCGVTFRRCLWQLFRKLYKNFTTFSCRELRADCAQNCCPCPRPNDSRTQVDSGNVD